MKLPTLSPALLAPLLLAACLDVSPPGTSFASEPSGARLIVDGRDSGWVTPCQVELSLDETHVVAFTLPGHAPRELTLVPDEHQVLINWEQGVKGLGSSTTRFPILLPASDFLLPFREVRALSPGRVFVRLHPESAP